jgi:hypothetical protein
MRSDPERAALYRALARELLRLPLDLSAEAQSALAALLSES